MPVMKMNKDVWYDEQGLRGRLCRIRMSLRTSIGVRDSSKRADLVHREFQSPHNAIENRINHSI